MADDFRIPERREMPDGRREQRRAHLVRELRAGSRRRFARPLIVIPAVLAVVASGAFAATRIFDGDDPLVEDYLVVDCYERASLDSPSRDAVADIIAPPGERPGDRTPAEMCADLWESGELGSGQIVPPLASCVHYHEVVVFPGGPRTCGALELRRLPDGYQLAATRLTEFTERVAEVAATCTTEEEFEANLRAAYAEYGYELTERITFYPGPGRDCVGGFPRPAGILMALTLDHAPDESEDCFFEPEEGVRTRRARTAACLERQNREYSRGRDEQRYFIRMVIGLQRQICEYPEVVPDRAACLAQIEEQRLEDLEEEREESRPQSSQAEGEAEVREVQIDPADVPAEVRRALRRAEANARSEPPPP